MPRFLIALFFSLAASAHGADTFTFSNPPGAHAVGLRIVQQYDRTRLYKGAVDLATGEPSQGERTRPIQALVWYPAARGGKPVRFRDYLDTIATEDDFTRDAAQVRRMTELRIDANAGARRAALLRELARPMLAVRDARPAPGKYAVVIYAPSFSAAASENTDLCEHLASLGYVVLASPSQGAHARAMTIDLEGLETQAADIAWLIAHAGTLEQADTGRVAVVGFSWGGLANVLAAAKDGRIRALVSLDGSVRSYPKFVDGGKDAASYVTPARVAVPMLFLGQRPKTVEELNRVETGTHFSFLNQMTYSDVINVSLLPMKHADFSSYYLRVAQDDAFGDYTRDEIALAHSWAMRYVARFLDAYLKNDGAALAFVTGTPAANGAPPHMMVADIRRAKAQAPTLDNFVARLAVTGFDQAIPVYRDFAARGLKLEPNAIAGWGDQLELLGRPAQAREVFRLGTSLYPELGFLVDGLAQMQARTGQEQEALRSYRRLLELDPKHADAAQYLKQHGGAAP